MFFLNDGVYGSFNCLLHDHATVEAEVLLMEAEEEEVTSNMVTSSLWGPTCDGEDCVMHGHGNNEIVTLLLTHINL